MTTAKDESEGIKEDAMVEDVINSVLGAVVTIAEEPVQVDAMSMMPLWMKNCPAISPYLSATKDEEWLDAMLMAIEELELEYTPRPLPYRGDDGFLHSADVHPPQVDFDALGFNTRRLPTPELHPVNSCSPAQQFYTCGSSDCEFDARKRLHGYHTGAAFAQPSPFGSLPGLLTSGEVIQTPSQLFGFDYISGSCRDTIWAMSAC